MKVSAIRCLKCGDTVWSRHRHDLRRCRCNACYIDGGRDYTRVGFTNPDEYEILELEIEDGNMDNGR